MGPQPPSLEDIQDKLLKLEKQNRRFKQLGVLALVVPALMLVMGEATSKKTIEANEFVLKDSGNNVRARLSIHQPLDIPQLELFDEKGRPSVAFSGGMVSKDVSAVQGGGISLYDSRGHERGSLIVNDTHAYLRFSDENGALKSTIGENMIVVEDGAIVVRSEGKDISTMVGGEVIVSDDQGFETRVGTTSLVTPRTGESHRTSAASVTMFDKNKNVIWKAP
jgi:hypothetical protein